MSFADDGLAGKHMAGLPGISTPFAILSWPLTSALLHCEDAGLGAYNLLLTGAPKVYKPLRNLAVQIEAKFFHGLIISLCCSRMQL